jgi:hypothetical protein
MFFSHFQTVADQSLYSFCYVPDAQMVTYLTHQCNLITYKERPTPLILTVCFLALSHTNPSQYTTITTCHTQNLLQCSLFQSDLLPYSIRFAPQSPATISCPLCTYKHDSCNPTFSKTCQHPFAHMSCDTGPGSVTMLHLSLDFRKFSATKSTLTPISNASTIYNYNPRLMPQNSTSHLGRRHPPQQTT